MATVPTVPTGYTLEEAEADIAELRGQLEILQEAHSQGDSTGQPNTPAAGVTGFSSAGHHKYVSTDTNSYNTGTLRLSILAALTISSTSPVTVAGGGVALSAPVAAAHYKFRFVGSIATNSGTGPTAVAFRISCPAFTTGSYSASFSGTGGPFTWRFDNTSGGGVDLLGPALTSGSGIFYGFDVEGDIVFTSPGTLLLQARQNAGSISYVIASNSFMELSPIT